MSRKQQKAVFASFGNPGSSTGSNRDKVLEKEFPKALPTFKYKGRKYVIDERLNEVRSLEPGKKPIFIRGKKANEFVRKATAKKDNFASKFVSVDGKVFSVPAEGRTLEVGREKFRLPVLSKSEEEQRLKFVGILMSTSAYKILRQKGHSHDRAVEKMNEGFRARGYATSKGKWFSMQNLPPKLRGKKAKIVTKK